MQNKKVMTLYKSIYLRCVRSASRFSFQKHNKLMFLLSFPSTSEYLLDELCEKYAHRMVICYTSNATNLAKKYEAKGCQIFNLDSFDTVLRKIAPLLKSARMILCDNYYAILGGIDFSDKTKIVQIWHANGAIKKFGLEAEYTKKNTQLDKKRYQQVYSKFTHYVVSSEFMADIFSKSYHKSINVLPFGYPLTDIYFDEHYRKNVFNNFERDNPKRKKIALYVPTYRESETNNPLDIDFIQSNLGNDWLFIIHPHPHDRVMERAINKMQREHSALYTWSLTDLLFVSDCIVTDYSSVPFEYSLANPQGKIIYFCFDLEEYNETVGIQDDFFKENLANIADSNESLLKKIIGERENDFCSFNKKWNSFVNGTAVKQLIEWIDKQYED